VQHGWQDGSCAASAYGARMMRMVAGFFLVYYAVSTHDYSLWPVFVAGVCLQVDYWANRTTP
jgi:hypothetical protein